VSSLVRAAAKHCRITAVQLSISHRRTISWRALGPNSWALPGSRKEMRCAATMSHDGAAGCACSGAGAGAALWPQPDSAAALQNVVTRTAQRMLIPDRGGNVTRFARNLVVVSAQRIAVTTFSVAYAVGVSQTILPGSSGVHALAGPPVFPPHTQPMHAQLGVPSHESGTGAQPSGSSSTSTCAYTQVVPPGQPFGGQLLVTHDGSPVWLSNVHGWTGHEPLEPSEPSSWPSVALSGLPCKTTLL
jgi:hypothetical protein